MRIVAVSERPLEGTLEVVGPDGGAPQASTERGGGPPYSWLVRVDGAREGRYAVRFRGPGVHACRDVPVTTARAAAPKVLAWGVWPVVAEWTPDLENLFSAWLERLFDDPLDRQPAWPALQDVLRDAGRNFLHDHLGAREDDPPEGGGHAPALEPDCADLPYALRAYFAYKLGLPFGFSRCTRGGPAGPPRCERWYSVLAEARGDGGPRGFGNFVRVAMADRVHSGSARAVADKDGGDYYPVPLTADSLRPGRIYADPYGHVLIIVRRVAQTPESGGILLAVDGQPDGTVSRRRFWRGNFLFDDNPLLGSPGFKRFRPIVFTGQGGARPLRNDEIAGAPGHGDFWPELAKLSVEAFYDAMDDVLSPEPLDPERALRETLQALEEQVRGRVLSVKNGDDHFRKGAGRIDMPEGPKIFETEGPWEDFSTPSRDLRLLIAIDVVRGFPARVARRPERFAMPAGQSVDAVRAALEALLARDAAARRVSYSRSDGSAFELSLADVLARSKELEMAYNPNDCPEVRWGAPAGSAELATCRRHAPKDQVDRMAKYRSWFAERRRPARK
ncbi:MAG: hypothetical protein HY908_27990 [Myxococcales bacterium]|nr:hypothetical protein [Myxococcales bacterium]